MMGYTLLERTYRARLRLVMLRKNVSIISNDCWGGQAYKYAGVPYNTPFVGLFMMAPCYLRLLSDLQQHLKHGQFKFVADSIYDSTNAFRNERQWMYPIGRLNGEIEVHFMHYKTAEEAALKWGQRSDRMNFKNLAVKFDGAKDGADAGLVSCFGGLAYTKKLLISNTASCTSLPFEICCDDWVMDGAKMFRMTHGRLDLLQWLDTGEVDRTLKSRLIHELIVKNSKQLL